MISLYNRDGANLYIDDEGYLHSDKDYVLEYMRVGGDGSANDIQFIDPSGGPFIEVGDKIANKTVAAIIPNNRGWKILFK